MCNGQITASLWHFASKEKKFTGWSLSVLIKGYGLNNMHKVDEEKKILPTTPDLKSVDNEKAGESMCS